MADETSRSPGPQTEGPPPIRLSRRTVLLGAGALVALGAAGYWFTDGRPRNAGLAFTTPLRIPPLLESEVRDGERVFLLSAQAGEAELVPGVRFATMGFNGPYLAPTIRASRGERVRIHVTNELRVATTAHWHGMVLPATQDGTPHQSIAPGDTWTAAWHIDQPAATLWYHPHPHGRTELQVSRGMAGMFLIDDDSTALPSNYGIDDIPLILQDVAVNPGASTPGATTSTPIGRIGNTVLVNGTYQPQLTARTGLVRLRILNASAARCYNLELSSGAQLHLVGTDGGLLTTPLAVQRVFLSPAERAEVLVTLAPGEDVILRSVPHSLGMSRGDDITSGADDTIDVLRLTRQGTEPDSSLPSSLRTEQVPGPSGQEARREFVLGDTTINGKTMDMSRIDLAIPSGTREIWMVANTSRRAHNVHIHGAQFAVVAIDGAAPTGTNRGWKDTVFVPAGSSVELLVVFSTFADAATPYMYHCHMLWHEDQGMMAQYVLVDGEGDVPEMEMDEDAHHHG